MTIVFAIIFFSAVAWYTTQIYRKEGSLKNIFWPALAVKSLAGICVGIVYVFYYETGDTLVFFDDGVRLAQLARSDWSSYLHFLFYSNFPDDVFVQLSFGDERAVFMDKIVSLFCLVSFDNYWVIAFYFTMLSFFASWYLVKRVHGAFPQATTAAATAFLFSPSITFWSSGLIKETIAMAGLYFLCGILISVWNRNPIAPIQWLAALAGAYLLWSLKYYFAGIFFAIAGATVIYQFTFLKSKLISNGVWSYLVWSFTLILLIVGVTFLHPNFRFGRLLEVMVSNYEAFVVFSKPESIISFNNLEPTFASIMVNSPKALFSGLYRPLFFDANNLLAVALSIENLILLMLTAIALPHVGKLFTSKGNILLCAIVVYVMLLAIFITLSTPNLGTLARYRVGYLPFFVFLILLAPPIVNRLQRLVNIPAKGN